MSAHYSIEYRTHFTNFHQTVSGFIGATEQLLVVQAGTLALYFYPTLSDILILLSFFAGVNYNLENILVGIHAAKDKRYALGCTVPYI